MRVLRGGLLDIPSVTSIAAYTDAVADGDYLDVNGCLMRWWGGSRFEYPGRDDGVEGLWLPSVYWGGTVQAVYDATTAWDLAGGANVAWGWTWEVDGGPLGTIAVGAGETTIDTVAGGANGQSYLQNNIGGTLNGNSLVIVRGETTAGAVSLAGRIVINDATSGLSQVLTTTDGAAGRYSFSLGSTGTQYYSRAAGRWRLQLVLDGLTDTEAQCTMRDYDTQAVGCGGKVANFGASVIDRFQIGDTVANASLSTQVLTGNPAIVIVSAP